MFSSMIGSAFTAFLYLILVIFAFALLKAFGIFLVNKLTDFVKSNALPANSNLPVVQYFQQGPFYKSKLLLTENEQEFFARLIMALPDLYIFPQVAFSALMEPVNYSDNTQKMSIWNTFNKKYADYVVTDKSFKVVAIVELDDCTHNSEKDNIRDDMLKQAGYRVLRWESKAKPTIEVIAFRFSLLLAPNRFAAAPLESAVLPSSRL